MHNILLIARIEITFAKREVINGIEDIGFSRAIGTDKAVYLFRELQFSRFVIFKIRKFKVFEVHIRIRLLQKYNPKAEMRNLISKVAQIGNNTDVVWRANNVISRA